MNNKIDNTDKTKDTIKTLKDIAIAVTGSFDLDSLLQNIVDKCVDLSNASRSALFLYHKDKNELVMRAEKGNVPGLKYVARYSVEKTDDGNADGLTPHIFTENKLLTLNSTESIEKHSAHIGKYDEKQTTMGRRCQSWIGIPIRNPKTQSPIGVLKIENTIDDRKSAITFSSQDEETFSMIADIAAPAIIKSQSRSSKIKESTKRLSKVLGTDEPLNIKLREIVSAFKDITKADGASIWLKEGTNLVCRAGVGYYEKKEGKAFRDLTVDEAKKMGLTAWIAKSGKSFNIKSNKDITSHPQYKGTHYNANDPNKVEKRESFIGAPLKIGDEIIGVIKADNRIPDDDHPEPFFTDDEVQVFSYFTIITAIAVQNDQDFERARAHDQQLISLYNLGTEHLNIDEPNIIFEFLLLGLTHGDGVGFNRAILFDYNEGTSCLTGKMSVGQLSYIEGKYKQTVFNDKKNIPSLNDWRKKINVEKEPLDSPQLQPFVESQQIKLSVNCNLYKLVNDVKQPNYKCLSIDENTSPDLWNFLNKIESIKVNGGKFFAFSFQGIDKQMMVGFCDFVYSSVDFSDFRINEAQTIVKQISLALSRLNLKRAKDQELRRREEQSNRVTNALTRITTAVAGKFEMKELLNETLTTTMAILEAEACSIFLTQEENPKVLTCKGAVGYAENLIGATSEFGKELTAHIASSCQHLKLDSKEKLDQYKERKGLQRKHGDKQKGYEEFRNLLALPLVIEGDKFGVIKVENKQETKGNCFSDDDLTTFRIIATVIALTIYKTKLQEQKEQQAQAVREVVTEIAGELDLKKLLEKITQIVMKKIHAEVISIFLKPDDNPDIIECVAADGYAKNLLSIPRLKGKPAFYKIGEGLTGKIIVAAEKDEKKLFNLNRKQFDDLVKEGICIKKYNSELFENTEDICRNIMALPLRRRDDKFGVIKVENKIIDYGENFSKDDFETFKTIANIVSLVIENAKLNQKNGEQLKSISGKAAHRLGNQITNYDFMDFNLEKELKKTLLSRKNLEELLYDLKHTNRNVKRMIKELKDYAKPIKLKLESLNINDLIKQEVKKIERKKIEVSLDLMPDIPKSKLDSRVSESIKELLINAKRAIAKTQQLGKIYISTKLTQNGKQVEIFFKDNGQGVPDNFPLFEPFRSTSPENTGLGLVTVRDLMKAHGGNFEYIKQDKGACFKMTLPV